MVHRAVGRFSPSLYITWWSNPDDVESVHCVWYERSVRRAGPKSDRFEIRPRSRTKQANRYSIKSRANKQHRVFFDIIKMESVLKVGRTISGGVCRAAGAMARGARRILASVPLLGLAAPVNPHEPAPANETSTTTTTTGGEEAEVAAPVEESPAEEKTEVSSPTVESTPAVAPAPVKEEEKAAPASPTPVEEKKEEPTPAPTPVPVEEKKEEIEKVEPVVVADKVEVSPVQAIPVKIAEPEAPAENPAEVSATESVTEVPASPAPPVPAELPVLPPSEPALTEDVASVTKAIEDFEISDKAVAAAVNEAIESNNANEIVNDSLHQKVITE
ncbi:uncharacterized protein [Neodiprion pinetum]|uniref:uncharacterized protein isoform X3 n=1 Tax=Neodiprion pinetum TaxID=441929 RepID=UPI001EDE06FD|nr:fibrous sheath CABYR-binding protein-like isoform X3 [Neodiprion pinetum]